jgi:hypothetical protein
VTGEIRVTVEDLKTGESEAQEISNDYVIVCAGTCHVAHITSHGNGTHVLTIKGRSS